MQPINKMNDRSGIMTTKTEFGTPKSIHSIRKKITIQKNPSKLSYVQPPITLWKETSQSLTRERSPSFKIPNAVRFKSLKEDSMKNSHFLSLQLRQNIKTNKGINFAKSERPQHWVKGLGQSGPSPASYSNSRFLDQSNYKSISIRQAYSTNPESAWNEQEKMKSTIKGQSFTKFTNYQKSFMDHTRHRFYQPQNTIDHPGPGQYSHSWVNRNKPKIYTMRAVLKRFNEKSSWTPGPNSYQADNNIRKSHFNVKGTIPRSERTYLTKFQKFPSPNHYAIARFLEQYN